MRASLIVMLAMAASVSAWGTTSHAIGAGMQFIYENKNLVSTLDSDGFPIIGLGDYNYTFYAYSDGNNYYIRDENCNFVCANTCGTVYLSSVRVKHLCKFSIGWYSITNRNYKHHNLQPLFSNLVFGSEEEMLISGTSYPANFTLNFVETQQEYCVPTHRTKLIEMDHPCYIPDQTLNTDNEAKTSFFTPVKWDDKFGNKIFELITVPDRIDTYLFRSVKDCLFVCFPKKSGDVFLSEKECNVHLYHTEDETFRIASKHDFLMSNTPYKMIRYDKPLICPSINTNPTTKSLPTITGQP
ncbi:FGF-2 [Plodia interpunctella granulovirus]|uniref:FGF-2 n=1 Tax=Plodia interpunctella granulovirus TaxID=262175 RepID=A0A1L5JGR6_9BBAC|nr:FGF-2 [Plodia interpunctella granulovirus]APO13993.1 FGF-2 [Plodia interpunctella granulovirus]